MQLATFVVSSWSFVRNAFGIVGNPTLHVGGEHDAVMFVEPGFESARVQDWVHPVLGMLMEPGCEDVQVKGVLLSTRPPSVLGSEL